MNEGQRSVWVSLLVLLMALICTVASFSFPADSSAFPRAVSAILVLLAVADLVGNFNGRNIVRQAPSEKRLDEVTSPSVDRGKQLRTALLVFASAPLYIGMVRLFDFEIATFVYLLTGMLVLGIRRPVMTVVISVTVVLIVKALFFVLLDVSRTTTIVFGS